MAGVVRRLLDWIPLTWLGVLVLAGATAGLRWLAYGQLDLVVLVVGYGVVGLTGLGVLVVTATSIALRLATRHPRPSPDTKVVLETRTPGESGFSLPRLAYLPLVQIGWSVTEPVGCAVRAVTRRGRRHELLLVEDRGLIEGLERRMTVGEPFGVARVALRQKDQATLEVLPHAGGLRRMSTLMSFAAGDEQPHPMGLEDGDRTEIRRYVEGDPVRFIHWKVFGRTRRLMVRVPERARSPASRVVAYLVAGPSDDASAGAARVAVESGALGPDWAFSADGAGALDARNVPSAIELILGSVHARADGGAGLDAFLGRMDREGPAALVIFGPPVPGPWVDRVARVARSRPGQVRVLIAVDGVRGAGGPTLIKRALTVSVSNSRGAGLDDIEAIVRALVRVRADVVLLDRPTGRRLGVEALRASLGRAQPEPPVGSRGRAA